MKGDGRGKKRGRYMKGKGYEGHTNMIGKGYERGYMKREGYERRDI